MFPVNDAVEFDEMKKLIDEALGNTIPYGQDFDTSEPQARELDITRIFFWNEMLDAFENVTNTFFTGAITRLRFTGTSICAYVVTVFSLNMRLLSFVLLETIDSILLP